MKRKIADWIYNFWINNHTHHWQVADPMHVWQKCSKCRQMRNTRMKLPRELFEDEKH